MEPYRFGRRPPAGMGAQFKQFTENELTFSRQRTMRDPGASKFLPTRITETLDKSDVADITLELGRNVSVGRVLAFGELGAFAKRSDITISIIHRDGSIADRYLWKKGNMAELASALHLRGWPVNTSANQAQTQNAPVSQADELQKLADLHQRGVLTDDEFAHMKAQILERM